MDPIEMQDINDPVAPQAPSAAIKIDTPDLTRDTTRWVRNLYNEAADDSAHLAEVVKAGKERAGNFAAFPREVFARLYQADEPAVIANPEPEAEWAGKVHAEMPNLREWELLKERCTGDASMAGMATEALVEAIIETIPKGADIRDMGEARAVVENADQWCADLPDNMDPAQRAEMEAEIRAHAAQCAAQLAQANAKAQAAAAQMDPSAIRNSIRGAVDKANQALDQAQEMAEGLGYGDAQGRPGRGLNKDAKKLLAQRLKGNRKLMDIAKLAGRLKRLAEQKQRQRVHVPHEAVGIEQGAALSRLLPAELARLATPELEPQFARGFTEEALLQYRLRGVEKKARGPIIVCIDNSGSMGGAKEVWSKAVGLALLHVASIQKRAFKLIHWDTSVEWEKLWPAKTPVPMPELLDALDFFSGGGTNFEPPLREAVKTIREGALPQADVVFITDDEYRVDPKFIRWFAEQRKDLGFMAYGIAIGASTVAMESLGMQAVALRSIAKADDVEAAQDAVFAI